MRISSPRHDSASSPRHAELPVNVSSWCLVFFVSLFPTLSTSTLRGTSSATLSRRQLWARYNEQRARAEKSSHTNCRRARERHCTIDSDHRYCNLALCTAFVRCSFSQSGWPHDSCPPTLRGVLHSLPRGGSSIARISSHAIGHHPGPCCWQISRSFEARLFHCVPRRSVSICSAVFRLDELREATRTKMVRRRIVHAGTQIGEHRRVAEATLQEPPSTRHTATRITRWPV